MTVKSQFVPDWLTYEISNALAAIAGDHPAKKEVTVLRLAQAIANGEALASVFGLPGTCSKTIWYGSANKPGWKDDPAIAAALELATQRARWWVRVKEGRAVQNALDDLIDLSEDAVRQIASVVRYGQMSFARADEIVIKQASVAEALKASLDVLDRVSPATATKSTVVQTLDADQFAAMTQQAKAKASQVAADAATAWNPDNKPDED